MTDKAYPEQSAAPDEVWLFQGPEGRWQHFMDERHQRLTIESGAWIVERFVRAARSEAGAGVSDAQFAEWCERHDMPHHARAAFDDAASLHLLAMAPATTPESDASARVKGSAGHLSVETQAALYRAIRTHYVAHAEHPTGRYCQPEPRGGTISRAARNEFEYDSTMLEHFGDAAPLAATPAEAGNGQAAQEDGETVFLPNGWVLKRHPSGEFSLWKSGVGAGHYRAEDSSPRLSVAAEFLADIYARAARATAPESDTPGTKQAQEAAGVKPMTAGRASFFMERFLKEEKLLGPNEQAALHFVIAMLATPPSAPDAQQAEPAVRAGAQATDAVGNVYRLTEDEWQGLDAASNALQKIAERKHMETGIDGDHARAQTIVDAARIARYALQFFEPACATLTKALAAPSSSAAPDERESDEPDVHARVWELLPTWTGEDWNELLERVPHVAGLLQPLVNASCAKPPEGWVCSRKPGHDGPCAASHDAPGDEAQLLADAERWRLLRSEHEHEDDALTLCVFGPNDMRECLVPIGSLPGELDEHIDAIRDARKSQGGNGA